MASLAMQRRIANHLNAGIVPNIQGNRVVLQDVTLVRADGTRAPAAAEADRQATALGINLNMSFWDSQAATERRGNQIIAYDRSGLAHTVARRMRGQRVATRAGRRFYEEAPRTAWIIHIPSVHVRLPQ